MADNRTRKTSSKKHSNDKQAGCKGNGKRTRKTSRRGNYTPSQIETKKQLRARGIRITKSHRAGADAHFHCEVPGTDMRVTAVCGPKGCIHHWQVGEGLIERVIDPVGGPLTDRELVDLLNGLSERDWLRLLAKLHFGADA